MTIKSRIALTLPNGATRNLADVIAAAQRAEALGYDDIWLSDTGNLDALTASAMLLSQTDKLRIGIAVVPVSPRTPVALGAAAATLDQISPGRFILGIGSSSKTMIEGWHGLEFSKPLTRVRESLAILRQIFAGEKTHFDGEFLHSHNYRTSMAPVNVPLYVAALRANMLEMAAGLADGVILNLFPQDALPKIMAHIRAGAEKAGRDPASVEVVCRYQVAVTDDPAAARARMRKGFVPYFATSVYNQFLRWTGHEKAADDILAGWQSGDRERTATAFSDELIDAIAIIGSADECRARIHEYAAMGINTHIITPLAETPEEFEATLTAFAKGAFRFN